MPDFIVKIHRTIETEFVVRKVRTKADAILKVGGLRDGEAVPAGVELGSIVTVNTRVFSAAPVMTEEAEAKLAGAPVVVMEELEADEAKKK